MSQLSIASIDVLRDENQKYHTFINLGLFLAALTGIEIVIIFFPWNPWLIFWGLFVLSVIKFICVIAWFMHLVYDKFVTTAVFLSGLAIATGTVIALVALFGFHDEIDLEAVEILQDMGMLLPW